MSRSAPSLFSILCMGFFCTGLVLAASPAAAQVEGPLAWSDDRDPYAGWKQIGDGLWQRTLEDGTIETEAFGRAGLIQLLEQLDLEMVRLVERYLRNPTDEMADVLDAHLSRIQRLESDLASGAVPAQAPPAPAGNCSTSWSANAGPLSGCGNYASGNSSYSGDSAAVCYGLCDLTSYAYVERTLCDDTVYSTSKSCTKPGVINDSCSSYDSLSHSGVDNCYAFASSSIYCPSISWSRSATKPSSSCGTSCSTTCGGPTQCTVTATCGNLPSVSCTGSCADSQAVDGCYVVCDGQHTFCDPPKICVDF